MANNKLSIGRLELQSDGRWAACMQDKHGAAWFVANPNDIPSSKLDDGEYHLFRYNEEDQYAHFVSLHDLQKVTEALAEASRALTRLDPLAQKHDAVLIDEAMNVVAGLAIR